jgi:hypothetical protein
VAGDDRRLTGRRARIRDVAALADEREDEGHHAHRGEERRPPAAALVDAVHDRQGAGDQRQRRQVEEQDEHEHDDAGLRAGEADATDAAAHRRADLGRAARWRGVRGGDASAAGMRLEVGAAVLAPGGIGADPAAALRARRRARHLI